MDGFNRVILLGNIGKDPEYKQTKGGTAVLSITLATSESYRDRQTKERKERTEWHRVVVYGQSAENLAKFLGKGDKILVEGSNRTRSYEKDGNKFYVTEVISSNVVLRGKSSRDAPKTGGASKPTSEESDPFGGPDEDDIPF